MKNVLMEWQKTYWHEKVAHGRCEIQKPLGAEGRHQAGNAAQFMEVVRDADKGENQQHAAIAGIAVLAKDVQHLGRVLIPGHNTPVRALPQEIQKAVRGMAIVA